MDLEYKVYLFKKKLEGDQMRRRIILLRRLNRGCLDWGKVKWGGDQKRK